MSKVRKIHRYLSIFIAIQLLLWTISGIYFAFNKIELVRGEQYRKPLEVEYRVFKRLGIDILETNENGIKTYKTHPEGLDLKILSSDQAIQVAKQKTSLNPLKADLLKEAARGAEYRGRALPVYKITTDSEDGINIYVDSLTGDIVAIRSDSWRAWDLLWALHIMDYQDRDNINNLLLRIFSILALVTSITGILLFFNIDRTKENPFECIPLEGIAKTISPFLTLLLSKIFFFETMPTLKPAISNLSFEYIPGISAVSPPINLQSEILQPSKIPFKIFLVLLKFSFPTAM